MDTRFQGVGSDTDDDHGDLYVPAIPSPLLSRDDFDYYWSEELVTLYHTLKDTAAANGWPLFDRLRSPEPLFALAWAHSSRAKPPLTD